MTQTTDPTRLLDRPAGILRLAATFGLAAGVGEVLLFGAQRYILHRFIFIGWDVVWMAPLAEMIVFLGVAAVLLALRTAGLRWLTWKAMAGAFAFLFFLAQLLMYTPLYQPAAVFLALGLAVQFTRMAAKRPGLLLRLSRPALPVLAGLVLVAGVGLRGSRAWAERRALAGLPTSAGRPPNVLLIILDTVRASSLSLYGHDRPTTPGLAAFARQGVKFDWAMSNAPWTLPSHASFFTGRLPHELSANWLSPLGAEYPTLAEVLRGRGYATAGFVANLLYCDTEKGLNRGFIHYEDFPTTPGELFRSAVLVREIYGKRYIRGPLGQYDVMGRKHAADVNREFARWLDHRPDHPFFAFLNYFDAHAPYVPTEPYAGRFATPGLAHAYNNWVRYRGRPEGDSLPQDYVRDNEDRYEAMLAELDAGLTALFEDLDRRGLLDSTLVIIASDHGELLGEHNLMGHGNSLYLPVHHVPLLIRLPGSVPEGTTVRQPASLRDLPATVMDLIGAGNQAPFPGRSLARFWRGDTAADTGPDTLLMELDYNPRLPKGSPIDKGAMRAVILDTLHYILNGDQREELYRYQHDPSESNDLAGAPDAAAELLKYRAALRALTPSGKTLAP